jgi:hypothetical protein
MSEDLIGRGDVVICPISIYEHCLSREQSFVWAIEKVKEKRHLAYQFWRAHKGDTFTQEQLRDRFPDLADSYILGLGNMGADELVAYMDSLGAEIDTLSENMQHASQEVAKARKALYLHNDVELFKTVIADYTKFKGKTNE